MTFSKDKATREIGRAVKKKGDGTEDFWLSIRSVSRVQRNGTAQAKLEMATAMADSPAHLRRLSQTWFTWIWLVSWWRNARHYKMTDGTPRYHINPVKLRRDPRLSIGHWGTIGELMRREWFGPAEALQRLQDCAVGGISISRLREMTEGEFESFEHTHDKHRLQLRQRLQHYVQRYTLTPDNEAKMQEVIEMLR